MAKFSYMDWAQYIMIDYAQIMRKDPRKAKKRTLTKFLHDSACPFGHSGIQASCKSLIKLVKSKMVDGKVDPKNEILSVEFQKLPNDFF